MRGGVRWWDGCPSAAASEAHGGRWGRGLGGVQPRVSYSPSPLNLIVNSRGPESSYCMASIVVIYGSSSLCNISPYPRELDDHIDNSADNPQPDQHPSNLAA